MHRTLSVGGGEAAERSECAISTVQPEMDTNNRVAGMLLKISSVRFVLADATEPLFEP